MLPASYDNQKTRLINIEKKLFDGMMKYQDESTGMWRNVVNRSDMQNNKPESSGSALLTYAMLKSYKEGFVEEKYGQAGLSAFNGTVNNCLENDGLHNVYLSSGVETTDDGYLSNSFVINEGKGVGPLMMAAVYARRAAEKYNESLKTEPEYTPPVVKEGLVYNGTKQDLITAGSTSHGTLEYALGSEPSNGRQSGKMSISSPKKYLSGILPDTLLSDPEKGDGDEAPEDGWSASIPQGSDAGSYDVWYRLNGDAGHKDVPPTKLNTKIAQKEVEVAAKDTGREYGSNDPELTAEVTGTAGDETVRYTLKRADGENVGTYTITASGDEDRGNYHVTFKTGSPFLTKMTAKGRNRLVLTWIKVKGAEGYDIFFIQCEKVSPKKVKTVKGNKTFRRTKKDLKTNKPYKAVVKAYVVKKGKKTYVKTSLSVHAFTSGGTKYYTNPKSVTVKKPDVSLKAGKTYKIKAGLTKLQAGKKLMPAGHAPKLRYISSNKKIARVSKTDKITAKTKGSCKIYVIAVNGVRKAVKVTVN